MPSLLARSTATTVVALALVGSPWAAALLGDPGAAPAPVAGAASADAVTDDGPGLVTGALTARAAGATGAVETLRLEVPAVLLGEGDGLAPDLVAGSTHALRLTVLAAEPGPAASVVVRARGARLAGCTRLPLVVGVVATVSCSLQVPSARSRHGVAVVVVARGGGGTRVSTVYRHAVR